MTQTPDLQVPAKQHQVFIGGGWVEAAGTESIDVISPATEELLGTWPAGTDADIDRAVAAARNAFDHGPWPTSTPDERADAIARFSAALGARVDALGDVMASEIGSPRKWSTFGQVRIGTFVLDAYTRFARSYPFEQERSGAMGNPVRVRKVPTGVVGAIIPWNAPLFSTAMKLGPALAGGCTVVLKVAPEAPLHSYLVAEAAIEAGLPDGVLNIVVAGPGPSEHLVRHPGVDKISFTGSTAVGRRIGSICGNDIRRCTLELGGKSAAILLDDVDLNDKAVRALVTGAMTNAGQVCMSQSRLLAPRGRYQEIVDALAATVSALQVGDPFDPATTVGPLASSRQRDRVEGHLRAGEQEGARTVVGGKRPAGLDHGWYVEPTLLADVDNRMSVAQEEIFGPVLAVIPYDGDDEAVALANDSQYGLTGTVWTADVARGAGIATRVRAGVVAVNSSDAMDFGAPFGGFKNSGIGRELGPEAIEAYTEYQTILLPKD